MSYTIKAKIFDKTLAPIVDANIVEIREDGKVNNARSNEDGGFTIIVPSKDSQIKVSHIGYITEQFKADDSALYSWFELREDPNWLDTVTVGGANKKSDNSIWWVLLGLVTAGTGYYFYKKNQPKKVKV